MLAILSASRRFLPCLLARPEIKLIRIFDIPKSIVSVYVVDADIPTANAFIDTNFLDAAISKCPDNPMISSYESVPYCIGNDSFIFYEGLYILFSSQ